MAEVSEYKCPACGGAMEFDSKLQKMKCPYCDTVMSMEEFQKENQDLDPDAKQEGTDTSSWQAEGDGQWQEGETDGMKVYTCESCGGEIIADDSTGATSCPYCGNKVIMKGKFAGDLRPDYIIPFKKDKKEAKAAYLKHLEGKPFLPKVFKRQNHIDEIKGVYVPFWLFDADTTGNVQYSAQRVRKWTSGDTEYTETEYYKIDRNGSISFEHIPTDGSEKMDDTLMEAIEPFEFKDAVPFQSGYLAGYIADRYDVDVEERKERAAERIRKSVEDSFRETVKGYQNVTMTHSNVNIVNAKYCYVLYPVWILNTTWNKEHYIFAMNGQTGKMVGDLPADKGAFWKFVGISGVILGVAAYLIKWLSMFM